MILVSFKTHLFISLILLSTLASVPIQAKEVRIAVASNFKNAMSLVVEAYRELSGNKVVVSYGSTGKHYAQLINGAPIDIFYAADDYRPKLLEQKGIAVANTRFTYALGKLILWTSLQSKVGLNQDVLINNDFRYLALANPKLSPYGQAAFQVLSNLGLVSQLEGKVIKGENIAQTFQFVDSRNADLGFVAYSQIVHTDNTNHVSYWVVPQELYQPIVQQAIMINNTKASSAFFDFTKSEKAREIIRQAGYELP